MFLCDIINECWHINNTKFFNIKLNKSGVTISKIIVAISNITYGITCGYRSPSSNIHYFLEDIDGFFSDNLNSYFKLLIGNINIKILNRNNISTFQYLSLLGSHDFEPTIKGPTRGTLNSASCLDHIFIRSKLKSGSLKSDFFILNGHLTDHFPVKINFYAEKTVGARSKLTSKIVETLGDYFS